MASPSTAPPAAPRSAPDQRVAELPGAASPASVRARSHARTLAARAGRRKHPHRTDCPGRQRAARGRGPQHPADGPRRRRAGALAAAGGAAAVAVKRARDRDAQRTSAERARAYRLRRGEETGDGVRRIARGQLDLAGERLDAGAGARGDLDGAVHETRKAFKRLRALVRVAATRSATRPTGARTRSSATPGAASRARATPRCWCRRSTPSGPLPRRARRRRVREPARRTGGRGGGGQPGAAGDRDTVDQVQRTLEAARRRIGGWPLPDDGRPAMLEPGFERIYRRGRAR